MAKQALKFRDLEGLGQRLKSLRENRGETLNDVGQRMGVAHVSVLRWEKGQAEPPLEYLARLIESGDADPYWLLFGDEPM